MDFYNIAGLVLKITGLNREYFQYRLREYKTDETETPDISLSYSEPETIPDPSGEPFGKDGFRVFLRSDGHYINYDILENPRMNTALVDADSDWLHIKAALCDVEPYGGASLSIRSFNMVGEIFKYALISRKAAVIHSSSISYKNNGILFSAPSGTGKSTHTALWKKVYGDDVTMINDDMPVIRLINGKWQLCGTPWSGKTEKNTNKCVPLKAIVFLERGEKNEINSLSKTETIFRIMNQTMLPLYKDLMSETIDNIGAIVTDIPAYILKCNISEDAPKTVMRGIFNENQG